MAGILQLEDGSEFVGEMFGAKRNIAGEIGKNLNELKKIYTNILPLVSPLSFPDWDGGVY